MINEIVNNKLGQHIDDFLSDLLPIWYCSFCVIAFYVFPENNLVPQHGIIISLYYVVLGLFVSLPPVLLIQLFGGKFKKIAFGVLWGLGLLNVAIDVVVVETTSSLFSLEHVSLILGSNVSESAEFFESYFNVGIFLKIIAFEFSCVLVWLVSRKVSRGLFSKLTVSAVLLLTLFAGSFTNVLKSQSWPQVFLFKALLFIHYSPAEDLTPWRQVPRIDVADSLDTPNNIFVIIGESFSKKHSSLYGYEKLTNPLLSSLPRENFYVFQNIQSPDTHTVPSIKQMLTTYDSTIQSAKEWHDYLTIFDIAKSLGYTTAWISNQSKIGLFDNVVTRLAELADTQVWSGVESAGVYKKDYDETLLPMVADYINSCEKGDSKHLCFIHLMGSHPSYSSRYPDEFARFSYSDYPEALNNQKQTLSEYDNSIVYNDFVVHTILERISGTDCIAIYFSDHAQDIFQSSSGYYGHPIDSNPESVYWGKQIPMMVYVSDRYAARNPDFLLTAAASQLNEYDLKDLVFSLADIMGAMAINGEKVEDKSIFH